MTFKVEFEDFIGFRTVIEDILTSFSCHLNEIIDLMVHSDAIIDSRTKVIRKDNVLEWKLSVISLKFKIQKSLFYGLCRLESIFSIIWDDWFKNSANFALLDYQSDSDSDSLEQT